MRPAAILTLAISIVVGCSSKPSLPTSGTPAPGGADQPGSAGASSDGGVVELPSGASDMSRRGPGGVGDGQLTASQKAVAEAMTSIWENDTPALAYAYAENIHDGRGYTSGRAGFCTGTGDAIQVIDCYNKLRVEANGNLMAKYMPALTTINQKFMTTGQDQADTSLLDAVGNWISDWALSFNSAATRADFQKCQDEVSDRLYYAPAMQAATKLGLQSALTRAALYDMWINQGDAALVTQTSGALGVTGTVGNGVSENQWLQKFLELRRDLLAGDQTWSASVDRVAGYEKARRRGNWDLQKPIDSGVKATQCWPGGGYKDSQYSNYVILPDASWTASTAATGCQ